MPEEVVLHVYDLSQGIARQLSQALMEKQFDAVYHTGVVLYNTEYFYGGGIETGTPSLTPYGTPIDRRAMGTTERTINEIYEWIRSNDEQFSESNYNPMTHNCNHFSKAFCEFLGVSAFPEEILRQPDEFLGTGIGKLVGSLFGMNSQSVPSSPVTSEAINPAYPTLYIDNPKVYVASDEELIRSITSVAADQDTVVVLNNMLSAYNETQNYIAQFTLKPDLCAELFEVLALVCTTSSVDNVAAEFYPYNYITTVQQTQDTGLKTSFLRYLNNFFTEQCGMRDGREKHGMYFSFIRSALESTDSQLEVAALRAIFTFSRVLTAQIERIERVGTFLIARAPEYYNEDDKHQATCLNLICGAVGRMLLTFSKADSQLFNELRVAAIAAFKGKRFREHKAPCVKQIAVYLKLDEAEEEFF